MSRGGAVCSQTLGGLLGAPQGSACGSCHACRYACRDEGRPAHPPAARRLSLCCVYQAFVKSRAMHIREAKGADLAGILAIYNHAVLHTTAVWSEAPATLEDRHIWLAAKQQRRFPVLVAVAGEEVLGFASYGDFRPWPGYAHSVEHSVYVAPACHRRGVGKDLVQALIEEAFLRHNAYFDADCDLCSLAIFSKPFIPAALACLRGLAPKGFEGFRPAR